MDFQSTRSGMTVWGGCNGKEQPERPRGGLARACAAASRKRGSRELEETCRKHGPLNLAPLFFMYRRSPGLDFGRTACPRSRFDSTHASSRSSGPFAAPLGRPDRPARDLQSPGRIPQCAILRASCALASPLARKKCSFRTPRMLPVRKHQSCAVRPDSSGGRCRVPVRSTTGRYSRASFTKPSGLTSKTGTRAVSSSEADKKDYSLL